MKINHKCLSGTGDLKLILDLLPFHAVSICTFAGYRVAEVARRQEGPSPKSLDSDANFKPNMLFCRDIKIFVIYAPDEKLCGYFWSRRKAANFCHSVLGCNHPLNSHSSYFPNPLTFGRKITACPL